MGGGDRPGDDDGAGAGAFDLSSLTEAFRRERAGMRGPTAERTPAEVRDAAVAAAVAAGAVDPTTVLGPEEVESVTGDRVDDEGIGVAPAFVTVAFTGGRGRYRLGSIHGGARSRSWRPAKKWDRLIGGYPDAVPVEGLGDQAFRTGAFTVARAGDVVLFAEVTRDDLDVGGRDALAAQLLGVAIANLSRMADR